MGAPPAKLTPLLLLLAAAVGGPLLLLPQHESPSRPEPLNLSPGGTRSAGSASAQPALSGPFADGHDGARLATQPGMTGDAAAAPAAPRRTGAVPPAPDAALTTPVGGGDANLIGELLARLAWPARAAAEILAGLADRLNQSWRFHQVLGHLSLRADRLHTAQRRFRLVSKLAPDRAAGYVGLGLLASRVGQFDQAQEFYVQAYRVEPQDVDAAYNLAVAFTRRRRFLQAEPLYRYVLKRAPDYVQARYNLALISLENGRLDEAQDLLEKVLAAVPELIPARYNLAQTYFRLRDYDQAIATLAPLTGKPFKDIESVALLGLAYQARGDHAQALRWLRAAHEASPAEPRFMNHLANLNAVIFGQDPGQPDHLRQALQLWTRSLAVEPDQPAIRELVKLYSKRIPPEAEN